MGLVITLVRSRNLLTMTLSQFITSGDCKSYAERANLYLSVNDIADVNKQLAVFLSPCKDATYRRIKDVLTAIYHSI